MNTLAFDRFFQIFLGNHHAFLLEGSLDLEIRVHPAGAERKDFEVGLLQKSNELLRVDPSFGFVLVVVGIYD